MNNPQMLKMDNLCALCLTNVANCKGSHMAPHFLIQQSFSFDGKTGRDREVVNLSMLNELKNEVFIGRSVKNDKIEEIFGHQMTDEEIKANRNVLVRDYVLCTDCEKRLSVLEREYANWYNGSIKEVPPRISFLFWLSVIWRLSVGRMSILLEISHESNLRKILNANLSLDVSKIVDSKGDLGNSGYILARCVNMQNFRTGILGIPISESPYYVVINDLSIEYYANRDDYQNDPFYQRRIKDGYILNDGIKPEQCSMITIKQLNQRIKYILDETWELGIDPNRDYIEEIFREFERSTGKKVDPNIVEEIIEECKKRVEPKYAMKIPIKFIDELAMDNPDDADPRRPV